MHSSPKLISVILSTYNQPDWLAKVLWGYTAQTHQDFQVVIADDGSGEATRAVVEQFRDRQGLQVKHVWHADDGFQKCAILNRAIAAADGDYQLFSDGDCIPRSDFVAQHFDHASPGHFLSGGYYKLPLDLSRHIQADDITSGRAFQIPWLRRNGLPLSHRWLRIVAGNRSAPLLNRLTTTRATWNGNNSSGWTSDVLAAGGFDERMRYGGQDREFGERLENAGIRAKQIRFGTLVLHLDHSRGYANPEDLATNLAIRHETRQEGRVRTEHGLAERSAA